MTTTKIKMFDFWKDNKKDQHYQLSAKEIAEKFKTSEQWEYYQQGWPFDRALTVFICYGLNSVNDFTQYTDLSNSVHSELYKN